MMHTPACYVEWAGGASHLLLKRNLELNPLCGVARLGFIERHSLRGGQMQRKHQQMVVAVDTHADMDCIMVRVFAGPNTRRPAASSFTDGTNRSGGSSSGGRWRGLQPSYCCCGRFFHYNDLACTCRPPLPTPPMILHLTELPRGALVLRYAKHWSEPASQASDLANTNAPQHTNGGPIRHAPNSSGSWGAKQTQGIRLSHHLR